MPVLRANQYSGEHKTRADVANVLIEHEYELESYSISDKGAERTVTVRAKKNLEVTQMGLNFNANPDKHPDEV
jgi:hypothetical protein